MNYLHISVIFLDCTYHGKCDAGLPEWPPSPLRLFQAIVAAVGIRTQKESAALRWFEGLGPPEIITPICKVGDGYKSYVPNNDRRIPQKGNIADKIKIAKYIRPHYVNDLVHYIWAVENEQWDILYAKMICHLSKHMIALGWGIDLVATDGQIVGPENIVTIFSNTNVHLVPHDGNNTRIPCTGTLDELDKVYETFLSTFHPKKYINNPRKIRKFHTVTYRPIGQKGKRPYAVFELPEGISFRQEFVIEIAAMLRSLICQKEIKCNNRKDFLEQFPNENPEIFLAGHTNGAKITPPRFSYLPLPSIGYQHADGKIRRVLIAEPYDDDGKHAEWAQKRLRNQILKDNKGNERGILLDLWRSTSERMIERYVGEFQNWASVTPVLLPGYDDGQRDKADKLFLQAVQQAGLPVECIEKFNLRKAPYHPGSLHPQQYHRPDYLKKCPAWHAWIRFRDPLTGPLALGAGRHAGLGIFAAVPD